MFHQLFYQHKCDKLYLAQIFGYFFFQLSWFLWYTRIIINNPRHVLWVLRNEKRMLSSNLAWTIEIKNQTIIFDIVNIKNWYHTWSCTCPNSNSLFSISKTSIQYGYWYSISISSHEKSQAEKWLMRCKW